MKEKYQKLIKNLQFYDDNRALLEQAYPNKYLLIWEQQVAGIYLTNEEAMLEASGKYAPGTYLAKHCRPVPPVRKVYAANVISRAISNA